VSGVKKSGMTGSKTVGKSMGPSSKYPSRKLVQTSVVPREKENVNIFLN